MAAETGADWAIAVPALMLKFELAPPLIAELTCTSAVAVRLREWLPSATAVPPAATVIRPPFGASQKGAKLTAKLTVPPVTIEKLKSISLSATAAGSALPPETYTTPGDYVYVREIPASLLTGDSLRVDFQLDKAIPPSGADIRELGIIVLNIGLESK